jgi:acyl carrier protein
MSEDIQRKIIQIIAKEAQIDPQRLGPQSTMDDFDIPSISQFEILFAIEEAFDVELPEEPADLTLAGLAAEVARLTAAKVRTKA